MEKIYKFLIIDDESSVVITIERLIKEQFNKVDIVYAHSGESGIKLAKEKLPEIIICDARMPSMLGLQVLAEIRNIKELEDSYFILMSTESDRGMLFEAFDRGSDNYLYKPIRSDELLGRIKSAVRFVDLKAQKREEYNLLLALAKEVEGYAQDAVKLAVKFMEARIPASFQTLKVIADASIWIAQFFDELKEDHDRLKDLETAALLSFSGRLSLPDNLLDKPVIIDGKPSDNLMYQVPIAAKNIVSDIPRFENVGKILYHLYENQDGSGFPDRLQSWQIPLESRIIRVVIDFNDMLRYFKLRPKDVLYRLRQNINRLYDHRVITLFEQFALSILKLEGPTSEKPVLLSELKAGMTLTRDIYSTNGLKILPIGAILQESIIEKIISINSSDPILGNIWVKV